MEPLSDEQLNALPKEAIITLYKNVIGQLNVLLVQNAEIQKKIDVLQEQISVLLQRQFGRKSEKSSVPPVPYGQMAFDMDGVFFNEAELLTEKGVPPEDPGKETETVTYTRRKPKSRQEAVFSSPIETVEDDPVTLSEEELAEKFPNGYKRMPDEVYSRLEFTPAKFTLHRRHIAVYADKKNNGVIVRADHPHELLPHSLITPSLAASVVTNKFVGAFPLARYSSALERSYGINISRQVMAGWVIELHKRYLYRIYDRMHMKILEAQLIHCDETPFKLVHPPDRNAKPNHKSYMWVYHTHPDYGSPPIYLYQYCDGRGRKYPEEFLKDFSGVLVTDGYEVYHSLARERNDLSVAGCWVHCKRRFSVLCKAEGSEKSKGTIEEEAVRRIAEIFHVEHQFNGKSLDDKLEYRNTQVRPLVDSYFAWLKKIRPAIDKSSVKGQAITYSLNQEPFLRAFLNNPIIPLDNNDAERSIRKFVIGRKNWVIIDSVNGANASACFYSLAETAKANSLRPYYYFKYVLEVMAEHSDDVFNKDPGYIDDLLPWSDKLPDECYTDRPLPPSP